MALFVGLDVSVKETSVCVVDAEGQVLREARTATDPARIAGAIGGVEGEVRRVGLEAGPMAQWLTEGLLAAGLPVVCVETRHMAAALSAQRNKTDRNDARGIAHMMRMGWFRPVHVKTRASQEQRLLLASRRSLLEKLRALESELRGGLRTFGLRVGHASAGAFAERVRQLAAGRAALLAVVEPLLAARDALRAQLARLDRLVRDAAKADPACRLLMTAPGVGSIVALTFDQPQRFASSRAVAAHVGLTPRSYASGETDWSGRISRRGDRLLRTMLYEAAHTALGHAPWSSLKVWGLQVAKRRGLKKAVVAVARRLAVILHRMWTDGAPFRWSRGTGGATASAPA
jgi:transposase